MPSTMNIGSEFGQACPKRLGTVSEKNSAKILEHTSEADLFSCCKQVGRQIEPKLGVIMKDSTTNQESIIFLIN